MADSVTHPDLVAIPAAEDGSANVEKPLTEEKGCGEQPAVKIDKEETEAVTEQSSSVKEPAGIKTEDNDAVEPERKEYKDDKGTGHRSPVKGPYRHRNNSKFDPSVAEISSDPVEIRKQARLPRLLQILCRS